LQRQSSRAAGSPRQVRGLVPAPRRAAATSKIGSARVIPALITFDLQRSEAASRARATAACARWRSPTSTTVLAFRAAISFTAGWACSDLPADRGDRGCGVWWWSARAKLRPQTVRFHYSIRRRSLRTGIKPGRAVVGLCFTSEHLRGGCLPPPWCQKVNQLIITPDHRSSSNNKVKDTEESHVFKINY